MHVQNLALLLAALDVLYRSATSRDVVQKAWAIDDHLAASGPSCRIVMALCGILSRGLACPAGHSFVDPSPMDI